jgi:hypothetical protein
MRTESPAQQVVRGPHMARPDRALLINFHERIDNTQSILLLNLHITNIRLFYPLETPSDMPDPFGIFMGHHYAILFDFSLFIFDNTFQVFLLSCLRRKVFKLRASQI